MYLYQKNYRINTPLPQLDDVSMDVPAPKLPHLDDIFDPKYSVSIIITTPAR